MFIVKSTTEQSLVPCTPMNTHLHKRSLSGISSGYLSAHSQMMGLHCYVLTHRLAKDKAFNLLGVLQCPGSPRRSKTGRRPVLRTRSECVCQERGLTEETIHICGNMKVTG